MATIFALVFHLPDCRNSFSSMSRLGREASSPIAGKAHRSTRAAHVSGFEQLRRTTLPSAASPLAGRPLATPRSASWPLRRALWRIPSKTSRPSRPRSPCPGPGSEPSRRGWLAETQGRDSRKETRSAGVLRSRQEFRVLAFSDVYSTARVVRTFGTLERGPFFGRLAPTNLSTPLTHVYFSHET